MIERREDAFVWSIEVPGHDGGCFGAVVCRDDRGLNERAFMGHRGEVVMVGLLNKQYALRLLYAAAPVGHHRFGRHLSLCRSAEPAPTRPWFFSGPMLTCRHEIIAPRT